MGGSRARVSRAKTLPPALPESVITRGRLWEQLDQAVESQGHPNLMVLSAPSGFGKTTLLASWVPTVVARGRPVAWCALDDTDSGCYRFWSSVLAALAGASETIEDALQGLAAPHRSGDADFLAELADSIEGTDVVLVLENVQEVTEPGVFRDLNSLLGSWPDGASAVLSSRSDPPLPVLQRARLTGHAGQLRAGELAFREDEVALCCGTLSDDEVAAVWQRTEGWPAMVRLMELAVRGGGDLSLQAAADVELADYLFQENFRRQSEDVQDLLLAACVAKVVPVDLAVHLSGQSDAGSQLEQMSQRSGLVTRVEGHDGDEEPVYRFHPMLRAYLHGELVRRDHHAERKMQRLAAEWSVDHGQDLAAVTHAVATGDKRFVDTVVRTVGPGLINGGDAGLLLTALTPHPRTRQPGPWTAVIRAAALLDQGSLVEAGSALLVAEREGAKGRSRQVDPQAEADLRAAREATEVHVARRQGLPLGTERLTTPLDTGDLDLRILVASQRGSALVWQGDLDSAEAELTEALGLARGSGRTAALIDGLTSWAAVQCARSDFAAMARSAEEALELAESQGWDNAGRTAYAHLLEGWGAHQALDDGLARAHVTRAAELVEPGADPSVRIAIEALPSLLAFADPASQTEAADDLHGLWSRYAGLAAAPCLVAYTAVADARMSILTRRPHRVSETAEALAANQGQRGESVLLSAMEREATGHRSQARVLLGTVSGESEAFQVPLSQVEALAFAASLAHQDRDDFAAVQLTRQALATADRLQGLRPLVDAGEHFHDLLRRGRGRWGASEDVVARVLGHAAAPSLPTAVLTARELEVLRELSSLSTVEDIAAELFVSVNTVKTHLRSIYRKLGVGSRRAAVADARRVGLI
jgi:LuxR family maltose regulon positive regulatory protein